MPDHKQCWKCGTQVELVDEEGLCWPCRLGDEAAWVHSSDVAKARIAELERERDEWKRRAERAEGQNCESCGCSIEVPDGSGFVAWICAVCWNAVVCARDEARTALAAERASNSLNVPVADVDDFYKDEGDETR